MYVHGRMDTVPSSGSARCCSRPGWSRPHGTRCPQSGCAEGALRYWLNLSWLSSSHYLCGKNCDKFCHIACFPVRCALRPPCIGKAPVVLSLFVAENPKNLSHEGYTSKLTIRRMFRLLFVIAHVANLFCHCHMRSNGISHISRFLLHFYIFVSVNSEKKEGNIKSKKA